MEPIEDHTDADHLVFRGNPVLGDEIRLRDHPDPGKMIIESDDGGFESIIFNNPAGWVAIDSSGGDDTRVNVSSLGICG